MIEALNVAMIGAGRMARTHANILKTLAGVQIRAVVDNLPSNAKVVASELGARVMELDAVLEDPTIGAVLITTPTPTHEALICRAAEAGKAIFVEKPIADTLEAGERVVRVVEASGVPCQVGFQRRFDPGYEEAKRRIEAGELGRLENFRAISRDPSPPPLEFLKTSGGLLVDIGIHDFDTARFFFGEVAEVTAMGSVVRDERLQEYGLYDLAVATLRFQSGALGTVENALNTAYGYEIVADLLGENGKFHLEKRQRLDLEIWRSNGVCHDYPAHFDDRFDQAYAREIVSFARCVQQGISPSPDAKDALESLRLALAAQHALETGTTIDVSMFGKDPLPAAHT
jgi:myo-inositol 2-dehydrogenase/D-chiro-inositol 1-dehydrogenase/scyllo-inositol 2-dehydrogenase (NAD+)